VCADATSVAPTDVYGAEWRVPLGVEPSSPSKATMKEGKGDHHPFVVVYQTAENNGTPQTSDLSRD